MDVLVAPGLAAPATLPPELVAAQGIATLRLGSTAWASLPTDDPANTVWGARLLGDVELSQSAVDALGIGGRVALGLADIDLWDGDGALGDLVRYGTADGRRVAIRVAPVAAARASNTGTAFAATSLAFQGIVRAVEHGEFSRARLAVVDVAERLATPLQVSRYAGTGSMEGPTALAGRPKPVCLGRVFNVTPIALGNIDLGYGSLPTYQSHWRAIGGHDAVRIRGVAQTAVTTTPLVGQFIDLPALGAFQLGSSPDGTVTADVRGDAVPLYVGTSAMVLKRLVQSLGPGFTDAELHADAWAFADTDMTGEIGWFRGTDEISASDAASQIVAATGAVLAGGRAGLLRAFDPLAAGPDQFTLPSAWILDCKPVALPAALRPLPVAVAVDWQRNWTPMTDLAGSVAGTLRAQLTGTCSGPARAISTLITNRVAQQRDLAFPGLYWSQADAAARAAKWQSFLEAGPRVFEITTDRYLGQVECGDIGRVFYPAYRLDGGARCVVVGWREALGARRLTLTVVTLPEV